MQKGPSQITSGQIAPTISGPRKDKDVLVVSGLILSLAAVIGAFWYYSSTEQTAGHEQLNGAQVSEALKHTPTGITPVSLSRSTPCLRLKGSDRCDHLSFPHTAFHQ